MTELRTARPLRVGLLWHSPNSGNLGVGALTVANMSIVREVAQELGITPQFTIIGMRDQDPRYVSEAEADQFSVTSRALVAPSGCWRVLGSQDCILDIGAGDSFADIYGPKRFAFLWLTKAMAEARGVPLVLSPQTIGPFTRTPYLQLARPVLEKARAVVTRDEASLTFLRKLAPKARGVLSVDVAFALPYEDQSWRRGADGKLRVGVNVSGLLLGESVSGRNRFGLQADYGELMRQFMAELSLREDVEIHLLTHANGKASGADDDGWAVDQFAKAFPSARRAPDFASPQAAKSYISGLDFLTAGRMHACIAAYSAGTAVVPIAYSRKFAGLFGMLDYPWMVPVRGMSTEQALQFLMGALEGRADLTQAAAIGMSRVDDLLEAYRKELRALFLQAVT